ncbi:3-deoxy-manno-octulosonate cytidylyltransferase [Nitrospira defluvii]|nr:3-deoxy-manno-octulosonate cytidylyltransferase [Nitrospira defluvii]
MEQAPLVVIPARYESSRFPGKSLADLQGKPIIQHVWERAASANLPGRVIVATDDERIATCVREFGAEVCLTALSHKNGTERIAEVAASLDYDIVVNLQGDLPLFQPEVLDSLLESSIKMIEGGKADVVTAKSEILSEDEIFSPNTVKVVTDENDLALYFSRSVIPYIEKETFDRKKNETVFYKHYGIYCYSKSYLLKIVKAPEGCLERIERLEQLRVLEQGDRIGVVHLPPDASQSFLEVNTPHDLKKAAAFLAKGH